MEHKIYYKYNNDIPQKLKDELKEAAITVAQLDRRMENLNKEIIKFDNSNSLEEDLINVLMKDKIFHIPDSF